MTVQLQWSMFPLILTSYAVPIYLQFVTFSLLIVFLVRCLLVMRGRLRAVYTLLYPGYGVVLAAAAAACGVTTYGCTVGGWKAPSGFDSGVAFFASAIFGSLSLCVAVAGYKTHRLLMRIIISEARLRKVRGVSHLVLVYFAVFISRTAYDLTYSFDVNAVQNLIAKYAKEHDYMSIYITRLVFYALLEVAPSVFLLRVFHQWLPRRGAGEADVTVPISPPRGVRMVNPGFRKVPKGSVGRGEAEPLLGAALAYPA